jgi:CRP/FNR family cyclic AMP-dependent transcriptional regulator
LISPEVRASAEAELIAPLMTVKRGEWHADLPARGAGLLVLGGLLIRRVGVNDRFGAELLGEGDLLRPWQGLESVGSMPSAADWRVLTPVRIAVLDERVTGRLTRYPQLSVALIDRALRRARALSTTMAIIHQPRVELRLHMLLWLLADRWGRVRVDGVLLPLALTHEVLAELIAVRRPTVSTALSELGRDRRVTRVADGFLLGGSPPGELAEIAV